MGAFSFLQAGNYSVQKTPFPPIKKQTHTLAFYKNEAENHKKRPTGRFL